MTSIRAVPKTYGLSPSEAAAVWAASIDRGDLTPSEEAELAQWLSDPSNDEALSRANEALHVFDADRLTDPHLKAMRQAALEATAPAPRRFPLFIAASLAALAVGAALTFGQWGRDATPAAVPVVAAAGSAAKVAPEPSSPAQEFASDFGKRRTIPLADGSTIVLNTNSRVSVSFSEGRRLIRLMQGQALFEVAHNPQRPFVVIADDRQVTALGTVFDVRVDPRRTQVLLVSGNVVVDRASPSPTTGAKPAGPVLLQPGQKFIAEAGRPQRVVSVDVKRELLWRTGFVAFDDVALGEAVAEINRYTQRPIELSRDGVADLHVSGVFRADDPQRFVETLSELLPIESRSTAQGRISLSRVKTDQ